MLQHLPNSTSPSWSEILGEDNYLRNTGPKQGNAAPDAVVTKESGRGKLRQLRQQSEFLQQPLHAMCEEAASADAPSPEIQRLITGRGKNYDLRTTSGDNLNYNLNSLQVLPGTLSPSLRDRLMGKSPLRLITERMAHSVPNSTSKYYTEKLECGHSLTVHQSFDWDEGGHMVRLEPTEKRRRCQECRDFQEATKFLPPKKPVQSVRSEEFRKRGTK